MVRNLIKDNVMSIVQWKDNAFRDVAGSMLKFGRFRLHVFKSEYHPSDEWVGSCYFIATSNQWGTRKLFEGISLVNKELSKAKLELIKEVKKILRIGYVELNKLNRVQRYEKITTQKFIRNT